MKCPFCNHPDTQVVETRESEDGASSAAAAAAAAATSASRPTSALRSAFRPWSRETAAVSSTSAPSCKALFQIALRKRPVSTELIDAAIERIEDRLLNLGQREIDSSRLGGGDG